MKKLLPIGIDSFRKIRETDRYYVDKTMLIKEFIERGDEVALITRPRRFGKTLNMTTIREFFDITADSKAIFDGLAVMGTDYAKQINTRPVIYFTFKDCKANTEDVLLSLISDVVLIEYQKYHAILKGAVDGSTGSYFTFFQTHEKLLNRNIDKFLLQISIKSLIVALSEYYGIKPIVLIDEYDQPIMSSVEYGYHEDLKTFFSGFYGAALKGQDCLHQALLTGIQRIVKESIFSQLNNIRVYTVADEAYSLHFGLDEQETGRLLSDYGLALDGPVKQKYNGYIFGATEMYNPWSILYYADTGTLADHWINTSTNHLIRVSISEADKFFRRDFDALINNGTVEVTADLECSFLELKHRDTLWGLLINSGYITVTERINRDQMKIRIPNGEVRSEFLRIIADRANVQSRDLNKMFRCLLAWDMEGFMEVYQEIVLNCTSHHDAKENAYHMLFLGMCVSLNEMYKITSNIESGHGRSDIRLESLSPERPHIIIEFKQGEDIDALKEKALGQIMAQKYYQGLSGDVLCLGIAHDIKKCSYTYKMIESFSNNEIKL